MTRRIEKILERWFILEPPLFQVLCLHELTPNDAMECPLRSGRRRLEYNPSILEKMSDAALEEAVKLEAVRLLLKHPYERFPDGCCMVAAALGSNVTVSDNYVFGHIKVHSPADFSLDKGMFYEWYAMKIQELLPPADLSDGSEDENDADAAAVHASRALQELAELWGEDEMMVCQINNVIESTKDWGTMPGTLQQVLKASLKAKIDWRKVLSGFRASILSSERKLTRMRPNRRTGFANMGSIRRFNTRLLVAVDVSGSVSDKSVSDFYGVVNSAFRYGFESVDVLQFDHGVQSVVSLTKAVKDFAVCGRGGTSFQEPVDFAHMNGYEGLVILTDGEASPPRIPEGMKTGILWVCVDRDSYDEHKDWMSRTGRVCMMQLRK
jgi:predicted metal-dependent peptidase